jgi:inner membrane protein involved in colicin E2 resistance
MCGMLLILDNVLYVCEYKERAKKSIIYQTQMYNGVCFITHKKYFDQEKIKNKEDKSKKEKNTLDILTLRTLDINI